MNTRRPSSLPGPVRPGQGSRRPVGRDRRQRRLVRAAVQVPASGPEAADWRLRGLAELVTQALATGDDAMIRQVDVAAAGVAEGGERFVDRLRRLRRQVGTVPCRYPKVRSDLPATRWPSPATIAAAVRCALHADRFRPDRLDTAAPPVGAASARTSADVATLIETVAPQRPDPRAAHGHRSVPVDAQLVWRTWFMGDDGPFLGFPTHNLTAVAVDLMFGLHVGVHLDHMAALHEEGRTDLARRLQFGRGLLVAESVAMAVELLHLAGVPLQPSPAARVFLYDSVVDRLARLPAVHEWGPGAAPGSPTMAAAAEHPSVEFRTLPTLAAAYVHGPIHLAGCGFDDEFVPVTLRRVLRAGFRDRRMAGLVVPAGTPVG